MLLKYDTIPELILYHGGDGAADCWWLQAAVAGHEAFAGLPEAKLRAQVMPFAKYKRDEAARIGSDQVSSHCSVQHVEAPLLCGTNKQADPTHATSVHEIQVDLVRLSCTLQSSPLWQCATGNVNSERVCIGQKWLCRSHAGPHHGTSEALDVVIC